MLKRLNTQDRKANDMSIVKEEKFDIKYYVKYNIERESL